MANQEYTSPQLPEHLHELCEELEHAALLHAEKRPDAHSARLLDAARVRLRTEIAGILESLDGAERARRGGAASNTAENQPEAPSEGDKTRPTVAVAKAGHVAEVIRYMEGWAHEQLGQRISSGEVTVQIDEVDVMEEAVDELLDVLTDADLPTGCGEDAAAYRALLKLRQTVLRMRPREPKEDKSPRRYLVVAGTNSEGVATANVYWGTSLTRQIHAVDADALAEKIAKLDLDFDLFNPNADAAELFDLSDNGADGAQVAGNGSKKGAPQ